MSGPQQTCWKCHTQGQLYTTDEHVVLQHVREDDTIIWKYFVVCGYCEAEGIVYIFDRPQAK